LVAVGRVGVVGKVGTVGGGRYLLSDRGVTDCSHRDKPLI